MKVETPNYTPEQEKLISSFVGTGEGGKLTFADATTIAGMSAMNDADGNARKPRSIVAKISRMGLPYAVKVATRKDGSAVASKSKLVEQIAAATGLTFEALDKAARGDLVKLRDKLVA